MTANFFENNLTDKQQSHIDKLADLIGQFIQYWGFKNIHGQIWTYIWFSKDPVDSTFLVKRLNVSKALVSLAVKDLINYKVIFQNSHPDRRKIILIPNKNIQEVIVHILQTRELKLINDVVETLETLSKSTALENSATQNENTFESSSNAIEVDENQLAEIHKMTMIAKTFLNLLINKNLEMDFDS